MKIWSTKIVEEELQKLKTGIGDNLDLSCFRHGDTTTRAPGLTFQYTESETKELLACASNVNYFADKYAHAMTDDGVRKISLRKYQTGMLDTFQSNRNTILLASRQIGKCITYDTKIETDNGMKSIGRLFYEEKEKKETLSFLEKMKMFLYKMYDRLND